MMSSPASNAEKHATNLVPTAVPTSTSVAQSKPRSCVVCRTRKVKCDKQSGGCQNCRRANIQCVYPSTDNPPRWARRLQRRTNKPSTPNALALQETDASVDKAMDRLRNLEDLVKELRGQLDHAQATSASNSPGSSTHNAEADQQHRRTDANEGNPLHKNFGRLVLQDASRSRYVTSAFWSRIDDELDGLRTDTQGFATDDTDGSEDESSLGKMSATQELDRTPSDRHSFLFRHNLNSAVPEFHKFQPLPSQIPFLLDVFSENVNLFIMIVHMPTVTKMARKSHGNSIDPLTPSNEALLFSIYYAAIISMEEDDVLANFHVSKADLSLKFRIGLEHALAKADFLNHPDVTLVQALATFLTLARRHDSPRFVYMMTGLVIRMAQYLGLQRDGAAFDHFIPYEVEMRRRIWWTVCSLDLRASEDQGMDMTITNGSFDTKVPSNISEADIDPTSKKTLTERYGVTDTSFARVSAGMTDVMRQMTANVAGGTATGLEEQRRLLNEIYQKIEHGYFRFTSPAGNIKHWVGVNVARLVMAKMTLIVSLPVLFSSPSEHMSEEIRDKLLVSAIEVAEYNHALNAEEACRQWRWVYQSHTHWHSIVFLLIETTRRPWSPIVERAWVALQSPWLIPAHTPADKTLRIWIPLRKLMLKAAKHREAELQRLRAESEDISRLEVEDAKIPLPTSEWILSNGSGTDDFRVRWRQLVSQPMEPEHERKGYRAAGSQIAEQNPVGIQPPSEGSPSIGSNKSMSDRPMETTYHRAGEHQNGWNQGDPNFRNPNISPTTNATSGAGTGLGVEPLFNPQAMGPTDWADGVTTGHGLFPWLWADANPAVEMSSDIGLGSFDADMDLENEANWLDFFESAKGMQWNGQP